SSFDGAYTSLSSIPAILTEFTGLADASGVLTNDGAGNLSWGAGGGTYTAGDGLTLVSDEFSVDETFAFEWTAQHVWSSSAPAIAMYETDAAANERAWWWRLNGK